MVNFQIEKDEYRSQSQSQLSHNLQEMVGTTMERRTSSRRKRPSASQHESTHPIDNAKDASIYSPHALMKIRSRNPEYFDKLDFVHVTNEVIEYLFVNESIRSKHSKVLHPPLARRRTATQIREFYRLGTSQCQEQIKQYEDYSLNATALPNIAEDEVKEPTPCRGISLDDIKGLSTTKERIKMMTEGFIDLVEEAMTNSARLLRENSKKWSRLLRWPTKGVALFGMKKQVRWRLVEEIPEDDKAEGDSSILPGIGEEEEEFDLLDALSFRAESCTGGNAVEGSTLCKDCSDSKKAFQRRCMSTHQMSNKPVSKKTNDRFLRTVSQQQSKINDQKKTIDNERKKKDYWKKKYDKMSNDKNGVNVPMNEASKAIFNHEGTAHLEEWLKNEPSKKSTAKYIFEEACRKHKVAEQSGAKAVRHCPLTYRLGIIIRKKMGYAGGLYDLVAESLGLPCDRSLNEYTIPNSTDPDGIMYSSIAREADLYRKNNPPEKQSFHFDQHVFVAFDSMSVKGRVVVGYHTNEIVGFGHDAFEEDILMSELEDLEATGGDGLETEEHKAKTAEKESKKPTVPPLAKHFLVVIATTTSASATHKHTFLVARYGLTTMDEARIDKVLTECYLALAREGWIAVQTSGDGASENRAYFKNAATITAREVFDGHFPDEDLTDLPLDFNIAFPHPDPELREMGYIITIGGEMPHWVKKFRNNTASKTRTLTYHGKEMALKMMENAWVAMGDSDLASASLRKYKFTWDHFLLNSYNKMRVFLAMQALSQTMADMLTDYCKPEAEGGKGGDIKEFEPMLEIISAVNRLVDIMNGIRFKNGKDKEVYLIDTPFHPHIFELFDILRLFEDWKKEAGGFTDKFLTRQTYEDLVWMVFGVAALACTYLEEGNILHQGRGGSDVVEHFFAMIRNINPNPTLQQLRQCASKCSNFVKSNLFSWKGKNNAGGAPKGHDDYMAPMMKKSKTKK